MPELKPMTVKQLMLRIAYLIKNDEITDDTSVVLASDEEGNSYNYVYDNDNISCYDIAKTQDGKKVFVIYPCDSNIELEGIE